MKQSAIKKEYCQSCGMPLRFDVEEYLGTNADQTRSDEYCYYCLKDGEYIVEIPMGQMVDIWVKYTDKYNEYSATEYTPQELRALLNKRLPTLKRWKQKETTRSLHLEAVSQVKAYIDNNLFKTIKPDELAQMVNLSVFHFRRVFRQTTGENIGSYIQRIRLEHIAHLLISNRLTINEILKITNYQTKFSLSKAFRKHFGISMTTYRERFLINKEEDNAESEFAWEPVIKRLQAQKAICYSVENVTGDKIKYLDIWQKVIDYRNKATDSGLNHKFLSISMDNPLITPHEKCRFYVGIAITEMIKAENGFTVQEIPGGLYVVIKHKGNYSALPELYQLIHENWLPQNGYSQRCPMSFEVYLNSPRNTDVSELLTEIYIPIVKL